MLGAIWVITACSLQLSFEELVSDLPEDLEVSTFKSDSMGYSISLTKKFELVETEYDNDTRYELIVDTTRNFDSGTSMISIYSYPSNESDLNKAWANLISERKLDKNFKVHSDGRTSFLNFPSFYQHSSSTVGINEVESVSFLYRGTPTLLYLATVQVVTADNYPENLKELLYLVQSLKMS